MADIHDHPDSTPRAPVPPTPAESQRQARLAALYDAAPRAVANPAPVPTRQAMGAEQRLQQRLERIYSSPEMADLRARAGDTQPAPTATGPLAREGAGGPGPEALAAELALDPEVTASALREVGLADAGQQVRALGFVKAQQQAATAAWRDQVKAWGETISRTFTSEELTAAREVIRLHGSLDLVEALDRYGIGNHPALVRFVANVAGALRERDQDGW